MLFENMIHAKRKKQTGACTRLNTVVYNSIQTSARLNHSVYVATYNNMSDSAYNCS